METIFAEIDLRLLEHAGRSRGYFINNQWRCGRPIDHDVSLMCLDPEEVSTIGLRLSVGLKPHFARQQRFTQPSTAVKNVSSDQKKSDIMIVGKHNKNIYTEVGDNATRVW